MGTIYDQSPRIQNCLNYCGTLARKLTELQAHYDISEQTAVELLKISIKINDLDVKDEQIADLAVIISSFKEDEH